MFYELMNKLRRLMEGRYGFDALGGCLLAAGLFFAAGHDFLGGGTFGAALGLGLALYKMNPLPVLHALREPLDEGKNPFT